MRGDDERSGSLFSDVDLEARVPKDHPLRPIRRLVDAALRDLWVEFERLYAPIGRPSIPPERLVRALLVQAFYSVRSERQLMEQLGYRNPVRFEEINGPVPVGEARRQRGLDAGRLLHDPAGNLDQRQMEVSRDVL